MNTPPNVDQLIDKIVAELEPRIPADALVIGIHSGGVWVAEAIHQRLGLERQLCTLDITFYRDDFSTVGLHPQVNTSFIPEDVENRDVILVDDVLQTGRTVRAALNEVFSYGRPRTITLVVLVDRGMRELPIQADICGQTISLPSDQQIKLLGPEDLSLRIMNKNE